MEPDPDEDIFEIVYSDTDTDSDAGSNADRMSDVDKMDKDIVAKVIKSLPPRFGRRVSSVQMTMSAQMNDISKALVKFDDKKTDSSEHTFPSPTVVAAIASSPEPAPTVRVNKDHIEATATVASDFANVCIYR
jgi:hypothetical protein